MLMFKNAKSALMLAAVASILTACATATPYQPAIKSGASGYSQMKVENNRYSVSFSGNSLTDQETVETYLLYRAAELTVENGYDYFTVADKDTQAKTRIVSTGAEFGSGFGFADPFYPGFNCAYDFYSPRYGWRSRYSPYRRSALRRRGHYNGFGGLFYDPFFDDFNYREITKFKAKADIRLSRGSRPAGDNVFDARQVMANLGPKLVYPEVQS